MAKDTSSNVLAEMQELGAEGTFNRLKTERDNYTQRAEKCATYTIPLAFPKESDSGSTSYETPYNSVGARGVNNLASKLLLALLPPSQPFFRLGLDDESKSKLDNSGDSETKEVIEYGLSMMEQAMMRYIESISFRPTLFDALKQLIITGNALLFLPPKEGGVKCYHLRDYVVERDGTGNVLQMVTVDTLSRGSLPEGLLQYVENSDTADFSQKVSVYTHIFRVPTGDSFEWQSYQELGGKVIEGSEQTFPFNKTPWIPIRFFKRDGESYGRSFIDDYLGDLISLENLSKAIVDISMLCAKVIFLVNPSCQTNIRELAKCDNGAFVRGKLEDIVPVQIQKTSDLQVCQATASQIEARLSYCFLLNSAVQRSGERVTAEEIRYVAGELEDTLGGVYSLLSQEMQLPLIRCVFNQMQSLGLLPENANIGENIEPTVITGLDALGRGADLQKLTEVVSLITQFPDGMNMLNFNGLFSRIFTSAGIDAGGLVKTPEQAQADINQAQTDQTAIQGAGEVASKAAMESPQ